MEVIVPLVDLSSENDEDDGTEDHGVESDLEGTVQGPDPAGFLERHPLVLLRVFVDEKADQEVVDLDRLLSKPANHPDPAHQKYEKGGDPDECKNVDRIH
jgi:hypothetical protein